MLHAVCSFTYEVAPVFVLVEAEVLRGLRQLVGWTEGDGIFCPGGSTSNMYAMNLARYRLFPEVKSQGLRGLPQLTIFTSSQVTVNILPNTAHLKDACTVTGLSLTEISCVAFLSPPRAITL